MIRTLYMKDKMIATPCDFVSYFEPAQLLRGRDSAADLCYRYLRYSYIGNRPDVLRRYCSDMLFYAVFDPEDFIYPGFIENTEEHTAKNYFIPGAKACSDQAVKNAVSSALEGYAKKEWYTDVAEPIFDMTSGTGLPTEDKLRVFYILVSGYLIAGKKFSDAPITSLEAECAYLGKPAPSSLGGEVIFDDRNVLYLPAGEQTYTLSVSDRTPKDGDILKLKKIVVSESWLSHNAIISVTDGGMTYEKTLSVGESMYVTTLDNTAVNIHPCEFSNLNYHAKRVGGNITVYCDGKKSFVLEKAEDVADFWPLSGDESVCLRGGIADYSGLKRYELLRNSLFAPTERLVEIYADGDIIYQLNCHGRAKSSDGREYDGVSRLRDMIREVDENDG